METTAIINLLLLFLLAAVTGCASGLFNYFLDFCMWPGMIFGGYQPWLARKVIKFHSKERRMQMHELYRNVDKSIRDEKYVAEASKYALFKVFGGCVYCFGTWVAIFSWVVLNLFIEANWALGIIHIVCSHTVLRLLNKE